MSNLVEEDTLLVFLNQLTKFEAGLFFVELEISYLIINPFEILGDDIPESTGLEAELIIESFIKK